MKKVIFALMFLCGTATFYAQSEAIQKDEKIRFGINIGVNYSNLQEQETLSSDVSITNDFGFSLGILADFKITEAFSISPKAELSFNNSWVSLQNPDGSETDLEVMPIHVSFATHFILRLNQKDPSPYLYLGPNYKFSINKQEVSNQGIETRNDLALDFGIGLNKKIYVKGRKESVFNFAPELRYSLGLGDIAERNNVGSFRFHNISLIFNFL